MDTVQRFEIPVSLRVMDVKAVLSQQAKGRYHVNLSLIRQYEAEMLPENFVLCFAKDEGVPENAQILSPTQLLNVYFSLYKKNVVNPITSFLEETGFSYKEKTQGVWWSVTEKIICQFEGKFVSCFLSLGEDGVTESMYIDFDEGESGSVCYYLA